MVVLCGDVDYLMMPGIQVAPRPVGGLDAAVVKWLRAVVQPGHKVVSICSGALLAGKAGLLDGYACTTHHSSCAELAAAAPKASVLENRLFVEDRERYSSAGVTAGVDLMLHIVAQLTDLALAVSICTVLGGISAPRRIGSAAFAVAGGAQPHSSSGAPGAGRDYGRPTRPWTLRVLAKVAGASSRHLTRLFQEYAGMSITDYKNGLRVALARGWTHCKDARIRKGLWMK
jgi:transcriptional regulator GlxA family with amidase domain